MRAYRIEFGTRDPATGEVTWRLISAALAVITETPGHELVRREDRKPWETCPFEPITTAEPPTTAEWHALRLVPRSVHDLMRVDWRAGLEQLTYTWQPFYNHYHWTGPRGDGCFTIRRLKALALSVPIGSSWESLTPVDPAPIQLDLLDLVA